jgi:hypothetical protein
VEKIASWRVEKCQLDNFPFLKGKAASHETEEYNGKSDNTDTTDLKKDKGYDLTGEGKIFADIDRGQTGNANSGGCCEEGIYKTQGPLRRRKRQPQQNGTDEYHSNKAEDKDLGGR